MRRIPRSFQIMGHTIKVAMVSGRDWETLKESYPALDGVTGLFSPENNLIILNKGQQHSQLLHTLYHEVMHAVLFHMQHKLWEDEKFVDQLAGVLAQVELSAAG